MNKPVKDYKVLGVDVASAEIKRFDFEQVIVICDLLDADGNLLASDRYFFLGKQPFELTDEEIEIAKNPITDANPAVEITPTGE